MAFSRQVYRVRGMTTDDLVQLAGQAYIYGFPLVFDLEEVERFSENGMGSVPAAPFNTFAHATAARRAAGRRSCRSTTTPSTRSRSSTSAAVRCASTSLTPTAATTCCSSSTPGRTTSPTSGIAPPAPRPRRSCSSLPTGTASAPATRTVIRFPTHVATIVGRWAVDGEADMPAVRELQAGLSLSTGGPGRACRSRTPRCPRTCGSSSSCASGCRRSRRPTRDLAYQRQFAPLGLLEHDSPVRRSRPRACDARCATGWRWGRGTWKTALTQARAPKQNGWKLTYHVFRLQPRLLRGRGARRAALEAADGPGPLHRARALGPRRSVGQPRLRGGVRDDLRRRRRQRARRLTTATSCASQPTAAVPARSGRSRCTTARVLPRRQSDRALLDRRSHARPAPTPRTAR